MLGLRNDVTGCGESMQEMLYGMYCNASFWDDGDDGANTFQICDALCTTVYSSCSGVNVMVPDRPLLGPAANFSDEWATRSSMSDRDFFCVSSYLGPHRSGVSVVNASALAGK